VSESWTLARGGPRCARCGAEFREGQACFSALTERPQEFLRQDFCPRCWPKAEKDRFFSFWKACRANVPRRPRIDTEVVLDFFNRLRDSDRPDREAVRFVLALYLSRRRALKFDGVRRQGAREVLLFRRPRHAETLEVENPELSAPQISAMTEQLKELLRTEV